VEGFVRDQFERDNSAWEGFAWCGVRLSILTPRRKNVGFGVRILIIDAYCTSRQSHARGVCAEGKIWQACWLGSLAVSYSIEVLRTVRVRVGIPY
jgi:hypothetical protein